MIRLDQYSTTRPQRVRVARARIYLGVLFSLAFVLTTALAQKLPSVSKSSSLLPISPSTATLGNYPDALLQLSSDTVVLPDAAPIDATSINVSASTNFKGKLEGDPMTGVVRVTDAHPAGTYTVTVKEFTSAGAGPAKTFTLTVTTPATCPPLYFAVTNAAVGDGPGAVVVGDFNRDGKQDIAIANGGSSSVSVLLGDGSGEFQQPQRFHHWLCF